MNSNDDYTREKYRRVKAACLQILTVIIPMAQELNWLMRILSQELSVRQTWFIRIGILIVPVIVTKLILKKISGWSENNIILLYFADEIGVIWGLVIQLLISIIMFSVDQAILPWELSSNENHNEHGAGTPEAH